MKFFISKGIYFQKRDGIIEYCCSFKRAILFSIPYYLQEMVRKLSVLSSTSIMTEYCSTSDLLLNDVRLKAYKDTYEVIPSMAKKESGIYALIRSTNVVPDDVYIPASMKDRVKVIKHFRFAAFEPDYGDFLANVYLIKMTLNLDESLPVYLTSAEPYCLDYHHVFNRSDEYGVITNLKTYIILNKNNRNDYISLSKLV